MKDAWTITENTLDPERRAGREAVFTVGNGFLCTRGFFEEETVGLLSLGGIYAAGVFGKADYIPWSGEGRELVNLPNFFACRITIDGEPVSGDHVQDYCRTLDMRSGLLNRSYVWTCAGGGKIKLTFSRFMSFADPAVCGQEIRLDTLEGNPNISLELGIRTDVKNLNLVSSEPLPVQPGRTHLFPTVITPEQVTVLIDGDETKKLVHTQRVETVLPLEFLPTSTEFCGWVCRFSGAAGETQVFRKLIHTAGYAAPESYGLPESYEAALEAHKEKLLQLWDTADVAVDGPVEDQRVLRYNLLQLMQSCPWHTGRLSIGARGLTGEMYEGCVFWDTEIFMLPFFINTHPEQARRLLEFRYHTLGAAKQHAQANWFEGAMYPWQCSETGIEQTPQGVGAFYSIHVVSDIACALLHYWRASGDDAFMQEMGLEILMETAKFWLSRVSWDEEFQHYNILAVRGPNEYDVIVNNNLYTNYMARENLRLAASLLREIQEKQPAAWHLLLDRTGLKADSPDEMDRVAEAIYLCYDRARDLFLEDDMYDKRVPVDMKRAQPTAKRIIDTTIPYEALMLYRISKQADVIHLMNLFPKRFTQAQKQAAWDYYEPKTAHDSSLSYSQHAVMASTLGRADIAYRYFKISARLDLDDVQLNTISGLHFANFGGTYQAAVTGMCGVTVDENGIYAAPALPDLWRSVSLTVFYHGFPVRLTISKDTLTARCDAPGADIPVFLRGNAFRLTEQTPILEQKELAVH